MPPAAVALAIAAAVCAGITIWVARPGRQRLRVERLAQHEGDVALLASLPEGLRGLMARLIAAHGQLDEWAGPGSPLPPLATEVVSAAIPLVLEAARLDDLLERHDLDALRAEAQRDPLKRPLLDDLGHMVERRALIVSSVEAAAAEMEDEASRSAGNLEAAAHRLRLL